ncbi:MAG TPA: hypothetical protein PLX54_07315 [Candidatus Fermentibacter daniensis]|nr:MAG: hypothetical protein BWX47_00312 [candidate division Hyd24-12 bacterium ADurb.Bin004]HOF67397.1 hypothetical protein [Candidatus Fermentibacter daniensis]HOG55593.1 hypothetical protein [Candidatus Fermentibacter daniensis]HOR08102.1 hypothetical protein [Candidatus Fermentibacter daniensis]HOZ18121.1 hypothetical protein [Candidatus Fermentibacter daniensis]
MFCRICGHDNGNRGKGACNNCGFDLEYQSRPLAEQRASLGKRIDMPLAIDGPDHLVLVRRKRSGLLGVWIGILGLIVCVVLLTSFDRAEYRSAGTEVDPALSEEPAIPVDSLPIRVGSDIVYQLNSEATSAEPHTNLNLSLIPEGSTVAFIAPSTVPIKPLIIYMDQKNREGAQANLDLNTLCVWTDESMTGFESLPLIVQSVTPDSSPTRPVTLKILFTDQWLVGRVEEFSIEITSALPGGVYNQAKLDSVLAQVERRLSNRDIEGRPVEVTAMFSESTLLGDAFRVMKEVLPSVESRGFSGLGLRYFLLES